MKALRFSLHPPRWQRIEDHVLDRLLATGQAKTLTQEQASLAFASRDGRAAAARVGLVVPFPEADLCPSCQRHVGKRAS